MEIGRSIMMRANIINRQTGTTFGRNRRCSQFPVPTASFTVAGCANAHDHDKLLGMMSQEADNCYNHTTCVQECWQLAADN